MTFERILKWLSTFILLIVASIYYVGKEISKWNVSTVLTLIVGAVIAYYITTLPSLANNDSSLYLFLAGALAICAMILPGISGAFILVILGAYKALSDAVHDLDIKRLALFIGGAAVGLLTFSRVLKWLFKHYHNLTLALLTGFILGSLNKVWPWKEVISWRTNSKGEEVPLIEESIMPSAFNGDPQVFYAVTLMVLGFLTIFILERLGTKTNN